MRNIHALMFVSVFLTACGAYTYSNTKFHPRQELMPAYPASAWDDYKANGGAFR